MKFFDCDWNEIFRWLPLWEKLSVDSRRRYLLAASHAQPVLDEHYGGELLFVLDARLVERVSPNRVKPAAGSIEFRRIMRQLGLFPLFDTPKLKSMLDEYKRKHFLAEELGSSRVGDQWISSDDRLWLDHFLNASSIVEWEKPFRSYDRAPSGYQGWQFRPVAELKVYTYIPDEEVGQAAQLLVRRALEASAPLPMLGMGDFLPEILRPKLAEAFKAAVRYRLIYPALRAQTAQPVFWIHPEIGTHVHRAPIERPAAVTLSDLAAPSILVDDMALVLVQAANGECRLKREGWGTQLFAKVEAKLISDFQTLPHWLEKRFNGADRLSQAVRLLERLKFVTQRERAGHARSLEVTKSGLAWLRQSPEHRIHDLVLELHRRGKSDESYDYSFKFVPGRPHFFTARGQPLDLSGLLKRVWGEAALEHETPLADFIAFHARESQPLIAQETRAAGLLHQDEYGAKPLTAPKSEELWAALLNEFFWNRLVPLGGVDTGLDGGQRLCFRLNPVGEFLLGRVDQIKASPALRGGALVVQPNFEIVFLQANAAVEVDVSWFAERLGKGIGTLFRITRGAVIRAAAQGASAEQVMAALARHSSKEIPANVAEEIRAWFGACRRLPLRRTWLIETPDRETAIHVQKVLGAQCTFVKDTLVEHRAAVLEPALRKTLSEVGLFLGPPAQDNELPTRSEAGEEEV